MNKPILGLMSAGLLAFAAAQASAATSAQDNTFVTKAAQGGLAEVEQAQMAQQKSSSNDVKQFAQMLATDHTQSNEELQQIAQQQNLKLRSGEARAERAEDQKLRGLSGSAFDQAYVQHEVQDHQQTIADFRKEAQSGENPALKEFAQKNIPVLEKHLQMAESLSRK